MGMSIEKNNIMWINSSIIDHSFLSRIDVFFNKIM